MVGFAATLAVAAPLVLANERSLFHFPTTEDAFRLQRIERTGNEQEWPFSIASGYLMCAWLFGERVVYFAAPPEEGEEVFQRIVVISTNPLDLLVVNIGQNDLFAPVDGMEQLIPLVAPFERLGKRLCDQPRGSDIGPGEL